MEIIVDKQKCNSCGICVRVCPQMILEIPEKKAPAQVTDVSQCMGCFGCEDECKEGAIRLLRAPQDVDKIDIEPPLNVTECDVAVVGAGPAGLGAAISCARGGLNVVVFDKLPNRKFSHHNDGGIMFTLPGLSTIKNEKGKIGLSELDITLEGSIANKIDYLGMLGPNGLSTQNDFPEGLEGWIQNKNHFVNSLADLAEKEGAKIWYNAQVVDVLKDGSRACGVKLASGEEISAKVLVTADGAFARISEKAGFPVSQDELIYAEALTFEYNDVPKDLPLGYVYVLGDMEPEDQMHNWYSGAIGAIAVVDTVHIGYGFMMTKKYHPGPQPLAHYMQQHIDRDPRIKNILGDHLKGKKPDLITGTRSIYRSHCLKEHAIDGAVVAGDAWVDDGDLGNIPSLTNGIHVGKVIVEAAKKNDFSKEALKAVNEIQKESVIKYIERSKREKLAPTVLNSKEMDVWCEFLPKMNFPAMVLGDEDMKKKALMAAFTGNLFRYFKLFKYRKLVPYLLS